MTNPRTVALVLLSGGLDSSTALAVAKNNHQYVKAISINYGQRHSKELECASTLCAYYGVEHMIVPFEGMPDTMLTNPNQELPNARYEDLTGISPTYVPFRNGLMLSIISAHAQAMIKADASIDECIIYAGMHAEDAEGWAYPDCTPEFLGAMANAIFIGTYQTVRLAAIFMHASKGEIVTKGAALKLPYELTWSCYAGGEFHCGTCPTCRARRKAFLEAGVIDPTAYAEYLPFEEL